MVYPVFDFSFLSIDVCIGCSIPCNFWNAEGIASCIEQGMMHAQYCLQMLCKIVCKCFQPVWFIKCVNCKEFLKWPILFFKFYFEGIKEFSNWPTIPQVYFKGEFLGGTDIMMEMHQNGELIDELKKLGIRSALLDEENE